MTKKLFDPTRSRRGKCPLKSRKFCVQLKYSDLCCFPFHKYFSTLIQVHHISSYLKIWCHFINAKRTWQTALISIALFVLCDYAEYRHYRIAPRAVCTVHLHSITPFCLLSSNNHSSLNFCLYNFDLPAFNVFFMCYSKYSNKRIT